MRSVGRSVGEIWCEMDDEYEWAERYYEHDVNLAPSLLSLNTVCSMSA